MDTFERNLENAQLELQMDAAHYMPVLYRSQMELANVMSSLPTLLLLGFLIWSFRRTGRMMGGMGGGGRGGRGPFGGGGGPGGIAKYLPRRCILLISKGKKKFCTRIWFP